MTAILTFSSIKIINRPSTAALFVAGTLLVAAAPGQSLDMDQIRTVLHDNPPSTGDAQLRETALLDLDKHLETLDAESLGHVGHFYSRMMSTLPYDLQQPVATEARIWKLYNHSFIVKTPDSVYAFDLVNGHPGWTYAVPKQVLEQIDVLFVSHSHSDHSDSPIQKAIRELGGEVITWREFDQNNLPKEEPFGLGNLQVTAWRTPHSVSNYAYQVTTSDGLTVMHTGDTQHSRSVPATAPVDIMIINAWMNDSGDTSSTAGVRNAVELVQPRMTIPGHDWKLDSHIQIPYESSLAVDDVPIPGDLSVMTWGERYDFGADAVEFRHEGSLSLAIQSAFEARDREVNGEFDNLADRLRNRYSRTDASIGDLSVGDSREISRLLVEFALPDVDPASAATTLSSAKLRVYLDEIEGNPSVPVSVWHSITDNGPLYLSASASTPDRFDDETFLDTHQDIVQPSDVPGQYFEIDVTHQILSDIATDGLSPISTFRFQLDDAVLANSDPGHFFRLGMPRSDFPPELIVTFIPEPTAIQLGTLALLSAIGVRRKRRPRRN